MGCAVDGCDRPCHARGWCAMHYKRWIATGDPLQVGVGGTKTTAVLERFWSHVRKTPTCWLWEGSANQGYGRFNLGGRSVMAHRFAYEITVGPIPDGLQTDHLCRTPLCVNPEHLEPVAGAENNRRSLSPSAINAQKLTCDGGHPLSGENLYVSPDGMRGCRECRNEASRRYRSRRPLVDWGSYAPAIARHEALVGRPAPSPVDDRGRLSATFTEWMMALPAGWVTDVLPRNPALKALGNAVVRPQAAQAMRLLLARVERITEPDRLTAVR